MVFTLMYAFSSLSLQPLPTFTSKTRDLLSHLLLLILSDVPLPHLPSMSVTTTWYVPTIISMTFHISIAALMRVAFLYVFTKAFFKDTYVTIYF